MSLTQFNNKKTYINRFAINPVLIGFLLMFSWNSLSFAAVTPSGAFTTSIPIELPDGVSPIAPNLALTYSSNSGDGMVGRGWRLSGLSSITRIRGPKGIQYKATDTFAHSGVGKLVNIGGGVYHSEDESFMRFVPSGNCGNAGPCSWTAIDRNGIKYSYAVTDDSRIDAVDKNGAVRVWALNRVEDLNGNAYDMAYVENKTNGSFYPLQLRFADSSGI